MFKYLTLSFIMIGASAMAYEEPAFTNIAQSNEFSIRQYPATLRAEITATNPDDWENKSFMVLADYIFGRTAEKGEKIGMTVPVNMADTEPKPIGMTTPVNISGDTARTMQFYMPSRYTSATLPKPTDPRIRIVDMSAETMAVAQFSWLFTDSKFTRYRDELLAWIPTQGYQAIGPATRHYYNAPWTLPWMRRNEVWIPVVKL